MYDRQVYFDQVRITLFGGVLSQQQVDGQNAILAAWEGSYSSLDQRWLAYALATAMHETAATMWPIEEYGKGQGYEYGAIDPETGFAYYGRGLVQLTHRENYQRATDELSLSGDDDLVWHPEQALDPFIAAAIMFRGMIEGWFRSDDEGPQTLARYFNAEVDDAYNGRTIINGDKHIIPSWSNGLSIGHTIELYHERFLAALLVAWRDDSDPLPHRPQPPRAPLVHVNVQADPGVNVSVVVNGEPWRGTW